MITGWCAVLEILFARRRKEGIPNASYLRCFHICLHLRTPLLRVYNGIQLNSDIGCPIPQHLLRRTAGYPLGAGTTQATATMVELREFRLFLQWLQYFMDCGPRSLRLYAPNTPSKGE